MSHKLQDLIELAWEGRAQITAASAPDVRQGVDEVIADLNAGRIRVAERQGVGQWTVNQWVKKAVLLSFRLNDNKTMRAGELGFFEEGRQQNRGVGVAKEAGGAAEVPLPARFSGRR